MLEHSHLLLRSWQNCPADPTGRNQPGRFRRRDIVEPESAQLVGLVRCGRTRFSWLTRPVWEIYELPDASLLITLKRPWLLWRFWEVFEADQRRVGMIYRHHLLDGGAQRLGVIRQGPGDNHGRFVAPGERELGTFVRQGDASLLLGFDPGVDPFTRMTLLGAALALG
jgi:hypothetical protein